MKAESFVPDKPMQTRGAATRGYRYLVRPCMHPLLVYTKHFSDLSLRKKEYSLEYSRFALILSKTY